MPSHLSSSQPVRTGSTAISLRNKFGHTVKVEANIITSIKFGDRELVHPEAAKAAETHLSVIEAAAIYAAAGADVVTAGVPYPVTDLDHLVTNGNKIALSLTEGREDFNVNVWYYNRPHVSYLAEAAGKEYSPTSILYLTSPQIIRNVPGQGATIYLTEQNAQIKIEFGQPVSARLVASRFAPDCVEFTICGQPERLAYQQASQTITYRFWLDTIV